MNLQVLVIYEFTFSYATVHVYYEMLQIFLEQL